MKRDEQGGSAPDLCNRIEQWIGQPWDVRGFWRELREMSAAERDELLTQLVWARYVVDNAQREMGATPGHAEMILSVGHEGSDEDLAAARGLATGLLQFQARLLRCLGEPQEAIAAALAQADAIANGRYELVPVEGDES